MNEWHASGGPGSTEFRLIAKDGSVHWVRDRGRRRPRRAWPPAPAQGYMQDVTARKRAEAEPARVRAPLPGHARGREPAHALAEQRGRRDASATTTSAEVTGWPREELLGRDWYETVGPVERRDGSSCESVRNNELEDGSEERLRTRTRRRQGDPLVGHREPRRERGDRRREQHRPGHHRAPPRRGAARISLRHHDELTGLPNRSSSRSGCGGDVTRGAGDRFAAVRVRQPRELPAGERRLRPCRRATHCCASSPTGCATPPRRHDADGAPRRRRVHRAPGGHGEGDGVDTHAHRGRRRPDGIGHRSAVYVASSSGRYVSRRARALPERPYRHRRLSRATRTSVDDLLKTAHVDASRTTTSRSTGAAASRRRPRTPATSSSSSPGCITRSSGASSCSTTSRSSTSRPARSRPSRR